MTIANLFAQHREGKVSKEKFLYEARKDAQLPFISNLTSYDDAIKILKQRGVIKEAVAEIEEDYQAKMSKDDVAKIVSSEKKPITPTKLYAKYPTMHDIHMYVLLVGLANAGKLVTKKGTPIPASSVEQIMDRRGVQAVMALNRPSSANEEREFQGDPRDIEDPYGGDEYEDDEKDIDHNDGYDEWRDNQERDADGNIIEDKKPMSVANLIKTQLSGKLAKEAKSGVYIPKGVEKGTKINIVVEPGIRYPNSEFISDIDGKYTFNTNTNMGQITIPHSDLIVYSKPKDSINEQKDLSLEIDRMNPKIVAKATNFELDKLPVSDMTLDNYFKIQKKVVNKLKKNPKAYDDLFVANSSEMEKTDKTLQMEPVKKDNLKDKPNEMVKAKLKEAILKMLNEEHEIDYAPNNIVKLPEGGEGTIIEVKGGTLTIEMKDKSQRHYQMNVIKHANRPEATEEKPTETEKKDPKDELMEKIAKFLKDLKDKKKLKKETMVIPTTGNPTTPDSRVVTAAKNAQNKGVDVVVVGPDGKDLSGRTRLGQTGK